MPEGFVQVAPDSTGKMLRTRQRTIGSNTIQEQYVIAQSSDAVPINRVWFSTLRIPTPATWAIGNVLNLAYIWNGIATGGNMVSIRRLSVEVDPAAAHASSSPVLRLHRMSTQSGTPNGTVITPVQQYTADPAFSTSVVVRANHVADLTASTLAFGTTATQPMWSQTCPRQQTGSGFFAPTEFNMMPNDANLMAVDPLILRPSEGIALTATNGSAATTATAGTYTFMVKAVLAEFTYP